MISLLRTHQAWPDKNQVCRINNRHGHYLRIDQSVGDSLYIHNIYCTCDLSPHLLLIGCQEHAEIPLILYSDV